MRSVFVCQPLRPAGMEIVRNNFPDAEVWEGEGTIPHEVLVEKAGQFKAILSPTLIPIDEEILNHENLVIVSQGTAGFDNIDIDAATRHKVLISNSPDALTDSVADLAFGLLLSAARNIVNASNYVQANKWVQPCSTQFFGRDIARKTIGIIGAGRIGQAIGRRASGFDMKILYSGPHQKPEFEAKGAHYRSLEDLLKESDFVVVATPLSPSTRHLISVKQLAMMKKTAFLINIGRGGVVDSKALADALRNGTIAGAGLDVVEEEPIHDDHCLLGIENCIILPHIASATGETRDRMIVDAANAVVDALNGREIKTLTNRAVSLEKLHNLRK